MSKKYENILKNVCFSNIFTNFAFPKLRRSSPNQLLTSQQIEAARQAISRYMNREGQIWIRVFPAKPFTKKPLDTRMGKGKGDPQGFVCPITPGRILFEAEGVSLEIAKEAMRLAAHKLPIATKFIVRRDYVE